MKAIEPQNEAGSHMHEIMRTMLVDTLRVRQEC